MVRNLQETPNIVLNVWSLSEVELLQFVAPNICGFDPGLEAGSRYAIISNLVISLVLYIGAVLRNESPFFPPFSNHLLQTFRISAWKTNGTYKHYCSNWFPRISKVVYIFSGCWMGSLLDQAEIEILAFRAEQIHKRTTISTQNDNLARTIFSENSCHCSP